MFVCARGLHEYEGKVTSWRVRKGKEGKEAGVKQNCGGMTNGGKGERKREVGEMIALITGCRLMCCQELLLTCQLTCVCIGLDVNL